VASTKAQVECIVFPLKKGGEKDLKFPFKNFENKKQEKSLPRLISLPSLSHDLPSERSPPDPLQFNILARTRDPKFSKVSQYVTKPILVMWLAPERLGPPTSPERVSRSLPRGFSVSFVRVFTIPVSTLSQSGLHFCLCHD